jgi:hypothetical protein
VQNPFTDITVSVAVKTASGGPTEIFSSRATDHFFPAKQIDPDIQET